MTNHAAGNVTMGYLNPTLDHLRGYQEKASAYVLEALGLGWTEGQWPPRLKQSEPADTSVEEAPSINELVLA